MKGDQLLRFAIGLAAFLVLFALVVPPLAAQETTTTTEADSSEIVELLIDRSERDETTGEVEVEVIAPVSLAGDTEIPAEAVLVVVGNEAQRIDFESVPADNVEVMLVLDISGSMQGEALEAAKAAARSFVERLPADVAVGVVSFDDQTYLDAELGPDHEAAMAAIDALEVGGDTALFDAVGLAAAQFEGPNAAARRAVVVLTDGADSASTATVEEARAALLAVGARPFAMALATNETATDILEALVLGSDGRLDRVEDADALLPLYDELAAELASRFTIRFTPRQSTAGDATIVLTHNGTSASATADFPELVVPTTTSTTLPITDEVAAESDEPFGPQAFTSELTAWAETKQARNVAIALLAVTLLIAGTLITLPSSALINLAQGGRDRVAASGGVAELTERLEGAAERALQKKGRGRRLSRSLERAGIELRPAEFVVIAGSVALTIALIMSLLLGFVGGLLGAALAYFGLRYYVTWRANSRSANFVEQLPGTLQLIAGSLRAGNALPQACETVASETDVPTSDEFHRLVTEHRLGRDFGDSMHAMADRIDAEDFQWVVQAIDIHREVGGDLAEVLDNVNRTMRDRNFIRRQFQAVSAEGRYSAYLIMSLPFIVIIALLFTNPDYISLLFTETRGWLALCLAAGLMVAGGVWMRQLIKVRF